MDERHAAFGDDVFQARVFAVGAIAEIAMNREHGFRHFDNLVRREETDDVRHARIRRLVTVTATHAAADREIVADEFVVLDHGDEPKAIRVNVQVIHRRNDERDLEFARQIGFAVKRIDEVFIFCRVVINLHAINPDGMIRLGLRRERERDLVRVGINFFARLRVSGRGRRENVAVHVAASGERGEQGLVDFFDERLQASHHNAVELDALARGDAQSVIAVIRRELIKDAVLLGRHDAAGNPAADHHDVFLAGLAQVAVVLLVGTVKFQELVIVLGEMVVRRIVERGGNGAGQGRDGGLDFFVVR